MAPGPVARHGGRYASPRPVLVRDVSNWCKHRAEPILLRFGSDIRCRGDRAPENVILPEIVQTLNVMGTHLEELDFEDAVRVRLQARK